MKRTFIYLVAILMIAGCCNPNEANSPCTPGDTIQVSNSESENLDETIKEGESENIDSVSNDGYAADEKYSE